MAYQLERVASETRSPLRAGDLSQGIAGWLLRVMTGLHTRMELRRLLARRPAENAAELSPHLLKDIGLPHDFRPQRGLARHTAPV
jgi:uncharacterized protein YjiS (DUF1127 family)